MENKRSVENVLEVKHLNISFPGDPPFIAVNDLSFQMKAGKTLALVGQSGSGKSITSLAVMGLLPKQAQVSGRILLEGKDDLSLFNRKQYAQVRGKKIGMVFQEPMSALNPVKTCGYQLVEAILVHQRLSQKKARELAVHWLDRVKLPQPEQLFKRFPHQLSGGQKQRVMIAMAMCNHPRLLIADEPTTALDVTVQAEIVSLMKELQEAFGIALLFITHDLNLAKTIADDFLVMEQGKVIHTQPVFSIPSSKQTGDERFGLQDEPLLRAVNVSVHYAGEKKMFQKEAPLFKAVNQVSFFIREGETLGLVGESGCGKSTLSKAVLGLQPISNGQLFFRGREITHDDNAGWRNLRKEIQIIFQDPYASLNPRMKVGDAIKEPMYVHQIVDRKDLEKEVENLLSRVQMPISAKEKYPHEFSGGQRQRICIARALALRPKLVICDESVSALDIKIQAQILSLLQELQKEQRLTYLFITHDLHVVRAISNRVMVMERGSIVEQGETEQVMNHPEMPYTKRLLDAIPNPS